MKPILCGAISNHLLERILAAEAQGHHIVVADETPMVPKGLDQLSAELNQCLIADSTHFVTEFRKHTKAPEPHWQYSYPPYQRRKRKAGKQQ